jgi:ribosomal protein L11 methyltransferase
MIRLAVRCEPEYADVVLANLTELAPNGVEEERGPGFVEFAIYGPPGEVPELGELQAAAGGGLVDVTTTSVPDDWADRWQDFHRPIEVSGRLGVRPSWWDAKDGLIDVVVDPGRAFGTGGHPTTRLCLELLLDLEPRSLLDVGCGSGVLAIAAAKLGFAPVVAVDPDPAALEAVRRNANENGVALDLRLVDALHAELPAVAVTVANVTGGFVPRLAPRLRSDVLVASGYLEAEEPEAGGFVRVQRRAASGWAADLFRHEE